MSDPDISHATASTMTQVGQASAALVRCLRGDPRVQRAYETWRVAHGLLPGATITAETRQSVAHHKPRDLALLHHRVRHELGLSYAWLAPLLLFDFGVQLVERGAVDITPEDVGLPPGRRAKNKGEHLERYVEWLYRNKMKPPPRDTEYRLAKEDQARKRAAGVFIKVNPNVVRAGIRRAERLLAVLDLARPTI